MNNASWAIRKFEDRDAAAVIGVWFRSGRAVYDFLPDWQSMTLDTAATIFHEGIEPTGQLWVGTLGEEIVAYFALSGSYIARLYVDPEHWRRGWGSRCISYAKMLEPNGLELHTHQQNFAARRLYEKHGFVAVKFGISPPPECAPDVEYHWRP
jgi:GNAT superfamily N-acetyltransferase